MLNNEKKIFLIDMTDHQSWTKWKNITIPMASFRSKKNSRVNLYFLHTQEYKGLNG